MRREAEGIGVRQCSVSLRRNTPIPRRIGQRYKSQRVPSAPLRSKTNRTDAKRIPSAVRRIRFRADKTAHRRVSRRRHLALPTGALPRTYLLFLIARKYPAVLQRRRESRDGIQLIACYLPPTNHLAPPRCLLLFGDFTAILSQSEFYLSTISWEKAMERFLAFSTY